MYKILPLLFLFLSSYSWCQKLSLSDLQIISSKSNWSQVNQFLMSKGWEYNDSERGNSNELSTITWSYNKSTYNDEAQAWFYLYTANGEPSKIHYSVFNKKSYSLIQNSLSSNGYKLTSSDIEDDELISNYSNSKYILRVSTAKREKDYSGSITAYAFTLIKKAGLYDSDNGKKKEFYYGDVLKEEYTLKNGKIHGEYTSYYRNSNIKRLGYFSNGVQNGRFKEYSENGVVEIDYTMKSGDFHGPFVSYYANGKKKIKGNYKEGVKDGHFIEYDENGLKSLEYNLSNNELNGSYIEYVEGKLSLESNYKNDVLEGKEIKYFYDNGVLIAKNTGSYVGGLESGIWTLNLVDEGSERLFSFVTYDEGVKNGAFYEVAGDSLISGTYKVGKLNGSYKVFRDVNRMVLGHVMRSDTSKLDLITSGYYYNGNKSGNWKTFDITGAMIESGSYSEGEKSGKWNYYYTNYADNSNGLLDFSGDLYMTRVYKNGKKNGVETIYSYLEDVLEPSGDSKDSICATFKLRKLLKTITYKNDIRNGLYKYIDSNDIVLEAGNYNFGSKTGDWTFCIPTLTDDNKIHYTFQKGPFSYDQEHGEWIEYTDPNHVGYTYNYRNGKLHGDYTVWNDEDKPKFRKIFFNGVLKEQMDFDNSGDIILCRYEIHDVREKSFKCLYTVYLEDRTVSQDYRLSIDLKNHYGFGQRFLEAVGKNSTGELGYRDGELKVLNENSDPLIVGKSLRNDKIGTWTEYFYPQEVKVETRYVSGKQVGEFFKTLNDEPFSGTFELIDNDEGVKYLKKVKDGLLNGKTIKVNLETGKTVGKRVYKNGVLK